MSVGYIPSPMITGAAEARATVARGESNLVLCDNGVYRTKAERRLLEAHPCDEESKPT